MTNPIRERSESLMDTVDHAKTAKAQQETYRRYLVLHQERAHKAETYLDAVERRVPSIGEIDQQELLDACVRMLIDVSIRKRPAMDLAATFLRYVLLVPIHMRVPFVNAVAACCEADYDNYPDSNPGALRKKLHSLANKVGTLLYDLTMEFADYRLADPAQLDLFKAPAAQPQPRLDDGGVPVEVDRETGEVRES